MTQGACVFTSLGILYWFQPLRAITRPCPRLAKPFSAHWRRAAAKGLEKSAEAMKPAWAALRMPKTGLNQLSFAPENVLVENTWAV